MERSSASTEAPLTERLDGRFLAAAAPLAPRWCGSFRRTTGSTWPGDNNTTHHYSCGCGRTVSDSASRATGGHSSTSMRSTWICEPLQSGTLLRSVPYR